MVLLFYLRTRPGALALALGAASKVKVKNVHRATPSYAHWPVNSSSQGCDVIF